MHDFAINVLAGIFLMSVVWRLNKFGLLARVEAFYLSWERRLLAIALWLAPVAIPSAMLLVWALIFVPYIQTRGGRFSNLFVVWTVVVWFVGPVFERNRLLYRVLSRWYRAVVSSEMTPNAKTESHP